MFDKIYSLNGDFKELDSIIEITDLEKEKTILEYTDNCNKTIKLIEDTNKFIHELVESNNELKSKYLDLYRKNNDFKKLLNEAYNIIKEYNNIDYNNSENLLLKIKDIYNTIKQIEHTEIYKIINKNIEDIKSSFNQVGGNIEKNDRTTEYIDIINNINENLNIKIKNIKDNIQNFINNIENQSNNIEEKYKNANIKIEESKANAIENSKDFEKTEDDLKK